MSILSSPEPGADWVYWLNTWPAQATVLTRANAADAYPKALTPLTQDLILTFEDAGLRKFFEETLRAMKPSSAPMPYLSALWGYVYINADQMAALGDVLPGSSRRSIYEQFMGLSPDPEFRPLRPPLRARLAGLPAAVSALRGMAREMARAHSRIAGQIDEIKALRRPVVSSEQQALEWVLDLESIMVAAWETLMIGPGIASATFEVCQKVIRRGVQGLDGTDLTNRLHVGLGGNESAEAGRMVRRLVTMARTNPELAGAIIDGRSVSEIRSVDEAFGRELDVELDRFGFHTAPELELAQSTWRQDPTQVLQLVSRELQRAEVGADRSGQIRRAAEAELGRSVRTGYRWLCHTILGVSRRQMALRENAKIPIVLIFDELRRVIEAAAPRLVARGVLADAADTCYLRYDEFKGVLGGSSGPGEAEIERRRQGHHACLQLTMPELAEAGPGYLRPVSQQHILDRGLLPPAEVSAEATVLTGLGASSGCVTGTARVVVDPGDAFEAGNVLVAKTVDPGWSAALSCAGAVVLDIGGYLSHGAVVARELGIPCVVNTKGATVAVRSGETVTVDGAAGRVIIHREADATK